MERDTTFEGPKEPSCSDCKFAIRTTEGGMYCRRNPPTLYLTMIAVPNKLAPNMPPKMVPQRMSSYPPVGPDIWCGEHIAVEPTRIVQ